MDRDTSFCLRFEILKGIIHLIVSVGNSPDVW